MTLLDTLPMPVQVREPRAIPIQTREPRPITAAIALLEAVLARSADAVCDLLDTAPMAEFAAAAEILFLVLLADTGLDLTADTDLIGWLRATPTLAAVEFFADPTGSVRAAYDSFIDTVAATRSGIYKAANRAPIQVTTAEAIVGYGYALAAVARMRMEITGEDDDLLIARYRLATT